jgi:hypothetical protein
MRERTGVAARVLVLAAAACGGGGGAAAREDIGSCALRDGQSIDVVPATARFERPLRWVVADTLTSGPPAGSGRAGVRLGAARPFAAESAPAHDEDATLYEPYVAHARKASEAGRRFVAGVAEDGEIQVLAGIDASGDVAFVGDCQYRQMTQPFDRYVAAKGAGRPPVDVLRAVATSPGERKAFADFFAPKPPPSWAELPPERRQLDEGSTPRSVLAALKRVRLAYDVPASWRTHGDVALCTRLALGWGECTLMGGVSEPAKPIQFTSYATVGEPIELWALNERGDLAAPLGRLGVIPADAVARAVSGGGTLVIRPVAGVETFEQFRAAMTAGRTSLELAEVA